VIPFHALLARDLADQTLVARSLAPEPPAGGEQGSDEPAPTQATQKAEARPPPQGPAPAPAPGTGPGSLASETEDLAPVLELEERTLRRTQLLKLKAEAERSRLEQQPPDAGPKGQNPTPGKPGPQGPGAAGTKPVDPEQLKAGYQKAIELAPRAVEQMELAVASLNHEDRPAAHAPAEAARKILEEIQNAQPKQEEPKQPEQNKKNEDQQKPDQKDPSKNEQQPKPDPQKDEHKKQESQKKEQEQKKDQEPKKSQEPGKSDAQKPDQKAPQPQISRDQIEAALRKVRERQQEKHERDRLMKARIFGRAPVEKDW
jgi:hypothetical protein